MKVSCPFSFLRIDDEEYGYLQRMNDDEYNKYIKNSSIFKIVKIWHRQREDLKTFINESSEIMSSIEKDGILTREPKDEKYIETLEIYEKHKNLRMMSEQKLIRSTAYNILTKIYSQETIVCVGTFSLAFSTFAMFRLFKLVRYMRK